MTPPDRLVQAAAEALHARRRHVGSFAMYGPQEASRERVCECWNDAKASLAAAFAALPVDEIREQAREAAYQVGDERFGGRVQRDQHAADAASDAWVAALARELEEPT